KSSHHSHPACGVAHSPAATAATVTTAVPLLPPLVAVMVAEPVATPLASPPPLTVATDEFELPHVTVRPVKALPFASLGVATNCSVWPTNTLPDAGLTLTEATGTLVTVTLAVPVLPSLVAVIVPVPAATPVTKPVAATVITALLLLVQVTARPFSTLPVASVVVAASCTVWPTVTLADVGETDTAATGTAVTVTVAVSDTPLGWPLAMTFTLPVSAAAL